MKNSQLKINIIIGTILSLRMLSIFIIFPILVKYGITLKHANKFTIGLAIGSYGITQSIFQIFFSFIADKFGYKKSIFFGSLLFFLGSVIGFITDSIFGIIAARLIQGSGAISSALITLLLNLNKKKNRIKLMALIGINFAITFCISIIVSPILAHKIGIKGIFLTMVFFSFINILLTYFSIPKKIQIENKKISFKKFFNKIIKNKKILISSFSILFLHMILTTNFIIIPFLLIDSGLKIYHHWKIYLIVLLISFTIAIPFITFIEKKKNENLILIFIYILTLSTINLMFFKKNFILIVFTLQIFFIIFNILEFLLPIIINKESHSNYKGSSMGFYSTHQFIGTSIGGILTGIIFEKINRNFIFIEEIIIYFLWFILILKLKHKKN